MPRDWRAKWNVTSSRSRALRASAGRSTALANWSTWRQDTGQRPTDQSPSCVTHLALKWISVPYSAGPPTRSASNHSRASSIFTQPVNTKFEFDCRKIKKSLPNLVYVRRLCVYVCALYFSIFWAAYLCCYYNGWGGGVRERVDPVWTLEKWLNPFQQCLPVLLPLCYLSDRATQVATGVCVYIYVRTYIGVSKCVRDWQDRVWI